MQLELISARTSQEPVIEQVTKQLSELFKQSESSGEVAWQIGEMLRDIKSERSYQTMKNKSYASFDSYLRQELGKTEETVNSYIKIRESFQSSEMISKMLVSHLRELVNIKDERVRKIALKVFRDLEIKYKSGSISKRWANFSVNDVRTAVKLIKGEHSIQEQDINKIVEHVQKISIEKANEKLAAKHGEELATVKFEHISHLFKYRPIDEMGVVALFCVMFETLTQYSFKFTLKNKSVKLSFRNIRYVRTAFPDVSMSCKIMDGKDQVTELFAEFEYRSGNYIQHQHFLSNTHCHMIICWENNIDRKTFPSEKIKHLPPIFSLSEFLQKGVIELV